MGFHAIEAGKTGDNTVRDTAKKRRYERFTEVEHTAFMSRNDIKTQVEKIESVG